MSTLMALTGCQSATVKSSVTAKFPGNDGDSQLAYWHELADRPIASNDAYPMKRRLTVTHLSLPKSPAGLTSRMRAIIRNTTVLEACE